MPVGFASAGVDFDDLFDPDVVGDGPTAPALTVGGTPLKYAAIAYGSKRPDVGYAQGGVDVSNLWAAKGTATYVSDGGLPAGWGTVVDRNPGQPGTAVAFFSYRANGIVEWGRGSTTVDSGRWAPAASAPAYDIRYDVQYSTGQSPEGEFGQWLPLTADRRVSLRAQGIPNQFSGAVVRIQIRQRSSGVVAVDRIINLDAAVEGL